MHPSDSTSLCTLRALAQLTIGLDVEHNVFNGTEGAQKHTEHRAGIRITHVDFGGRGILHIIKGHVLQ